jgi:hypothetical protein
LNQIIKNINIAEYNEKKYYLALTNSRESKASIYTVFSKREPQIKDKIFFWQDLVILLDEITNFRDYWEIIDVKKVKRNQKFDVKSGVLK